MKIYAHDSKIAGKGCFAAMPLSEGELLGEYTGELLTPEQVEERYANEEPHYLFALANGGTIDAHNAENPLKFVNHSCEPNCEADEQDGRVFFYALRPIAKDEEITLDYNLITDRDHECICGARSCKGVMSRTYDATSSSSQ